MEKHREINKVKATLRIRARSNASSQASRSEIMILKVSDKALKHQMIIKVLNDNYSRSRAFSLDDFSGGPPSWILRRGGSLCRGWWAAPSVADGGASPPLLRVVVRHLLYQGWWCAASGGGRGEESSENNVGFVLVCFEMKDYSPIYRETWLGSEENDIVIMHACDVIK